MRVKVVHTSLDCSVCLTGKSWSGHGGNSHSEQGCKAVFYLTVVVSTTVAKIWGRGNDCKNHSPTCNGKVAKYLN